MERKKVYEPHQNFALGTDICTSLWLANLAKMYNLVKSEHRDPLLEPHKNENVF